MSTTQNADSERIWTTWGPTRPAWQAVYALGEPQSTAFARKILRQYQVAGARGARMPMRFYDPEWIQGIFRMMGTTPQCTIGWGSLFDPQYYLGMPDAQRMLKWERYVSLYMTTHNPKIVVLDQERGVPGYLGAQTGAHPEMIAFIRNLMSPDARLLVYRGDRLFWEGVGDGPCPSCWDLWPDGESETPVDRAEAFVAANDVMGGSPWVSARINASKPQLGWLAPVYMEKWAPLVFEVFIRAGATGLSLYVSPYDKGKPLDSPENKVMFRLMQIGTTSFRQARARLFR